MTFIEHKKHTQDPEIELEIRNPGKITSYLFNRTATYR